jgi:hypothetical protein
VKVSARVLLPICLFAVFAAAAARSNDGRCDDVGSTSVLAHLPVHATTAPPTGATYPEGVAIFGGRVIVSGPATFGTAGNGSPSQLTVFDAETGALRAEVPVVGENLAFEHALSELAVSQHYVYAPSSQLGVLRWSFAGRSDHPEQESVSTPFCSVTGGIPCHVDTDACPADIRPGLPPLPNGITVAPDGDIYVTDSLQGIVWAIDGHAARPATPRVLACSAAFQGSGTDGMSMFGANGIAIVGDEIYVAVSFGPPDANGLPTSPIYRFDRDDPAHMEVAYTFGAISPAPGILVPPVADGLRYDPDTDRLLVVLAGQNAVAELDLGEEPLHEVARTSRAGVDTPFLNPSTVALADGGHAYVSNHAASCCLDGDPNPACTCHGAADAFAVIEMCRE